MNSKKTIVIGAVIVLALAVGAFSFLIPRNTARNARVQTSSQPQPSLAASTAVSSGTAAFDTNDNLDQAIQDLNTIEK